MHSRKITVNGREVTLRFGHEGVLYKNSFVMYDHRTDSKWNHSTGLALAGPLVGEELKTLRSRMVHWSTWKNQHPETKVLLGRERAGFMGTYLADQETPPLGLSVGAGPRPTLYPFDHLLNQEVINDTVGGRHVVVVIDPPTRQAFSYSRRINQQLLTFTPANNHGDTPTMRDEETGTLWNRLTGEAMKGKLQNKQLSSTIAVTWRKARWRQIYENGTIYEP